MNPLTWTLPEWLGVIALLVSAAGGIGQLYKLRSEKNEKSASTENYISLAAERLIAPLTARVEELDKKVQQLSVENERLKSAVRDLQQNVIELSAGIDILSGQIVSMGAEPKWKRLSRT